MRRAILVSHAVNFSPPRARRRGRSPAASESLRHRLGCARDHPAAGQNARRARLATAKYASDLGRRRQTATVITSIDPDMGYHFMNPNVRVRPAKPPILVYEHRGAAGARRVEWVFPEPAETAPSRAPLRRFGAGCHYADGTFIPASGQTECPAKARRRRGVHVLAPEARDDARLALVPEPDGLFASTNPLVRRSTAGEKARGPGGGAWPSPPGRVLLHPQRTPWRLTAMVLRSFAVAGFPLGRVRPGVGYWICLGESVRFEP